MHAMSSDTFPADPVQPAQPVQLAQPVLTIEYARRISIDIDPQLIRAAKWMIWLAVFSGFCVFLSLAYLGGPDRSGFIAARVLHFLVFAVTLFIGVRSGILLQAAAMAVGDPSRRPRMILDAVAGVGLILLAAAPFGLLQRDNALPGVALAGIGFLAMATVTIRHLMLYRLLSDLALAVTAPRLKRSLLAMGWMKTIYEGLWLMCCGLPLMAVALDKSHFKIAGNFAGEWIIFILIAAFFGCFGYAAIWVWMIVNHSLLLRAFKRAVCAG